MRSLRTAVEILITLAVAIGIFGLAAWQFVTNPANPSMLGAGATVVGIVAVAVAISQLYAFVRGTDYVVEVTDTGIHANGEHSSWENVLAIQTTLRPKARRGFMNVSVRRPDTTMLTHLVEFTGELPVVGVNALKAYLDSKPYQIRWELRVQ